MQIKKCEKVAAVAFFGLVSDLHHQISQDTHEIFDFLFFFFPQKQVLNVNDE